MDRTAILWVALVSGLVVLHSRCEPLPAQQGEPSGDSGQEQPGPVLVAPENARAQPVPLRDPATPTPKPRGTAVRTPPRVQTPSRSVIRFTDSDDEPTDTEQPAATPVRKVDSAVQPDAGQQASTRQLVQPVRLGAETLRRRTRVRECLAIYYQRPENVARRSPWGIMHSLIAFGVDTEVMVRSHSVNAIGWLCWNGVCNGQKLFFTRRGSLGANVGAGFQGHDGQFLSMLAQSKVGRTYGLKVGGDDFDVMDLVEYEQQTCREGAELTFKLIGLVHYLPSDAMWENDLGESWNISRLIEEELSQSVVDAACGGTHRIMGLSYAVHKRTRRKEPFVGSWRRAKEFVKEFQDYTFTLQNRDASFSTNWLEGRGRDRDIDRRMETTGHILEWLVFSLPKQRLYEPRITRAVDYLTELMLRHADHDWEIGPRGHALHALALYDERAFGSQPGNRAAVLAGEPDPREAATEEAGAVLRSAERRETTRE